MFTILVCAFTWPLVADISRYLPPHWDPRLNAWNMASNSRRIVTNPLLLFQGNDFYPYGTTKAFSELLLVPSLVSMPVFFLSGNPVLSYNITLLLLWTLSGLTTYLCVREFVGHRWGALLGAVIWTLCPFRTDYYLEFQMQMCFAVPLVILYWYRFLRTQGARYAVLACLFLSIEALSSWSYAIMVSIYLLVFSLGFVCLKWRGWRIRKLLNLIPVLVIFSAAMFPFTRPYFRMRKELGMERRLSESIPHSADILTYLETGPTGMYHFSPTHHHAETSLFPGFVALLLLILGCGYFFRREAEFAPSRSARISTLVAAAGLLFALLQLVLRTVSVSEGLKFIHSMQFSTASGFAFGFSLILLVVRGWNQSKRKAADRGFSEKDILGTFLFTCLVMVLLSFGPVVHVKRHPIGHGWYYQLYSLFFPLHAMRVAARFGGFALFSIAILSALGAKWLHLTVSPRCRPIRVVAVVAFLLAASEYFPFGLKYEEFRWKQLPAVYKLIASDPEDFAIAEWPLGWRYEDGTCLLWSVAHRKKVLGGVSRWRGRMPRRTREVSRTLSDLTKPEHTAQSMKELRGIYPTKYLIVHRRRFATRWDMWPPWKKLMQDLPEGLVLLHVYDNEDYLFAISPVVERGREFSREFSYEYLLTHNVARFRLRAASQAADGCLVRVYFNDTEIYRDTLTSGWKEYELKLARPYRKVAPNCIRIVASGDDPEESEIEFDGFSLSTE